MVPACRTTGYASILNPTAGQGRALGKLAQIERALATHGGQSEIPVTAGPGHAAELARPPTARGSR